MKALEQTTLIFAEPIEGDCCPWTPKAGKHSRLHIIYARLRAGMHPLGHADLANNGETCGTCSGAATDLRLKWPACTLWKVS